MCNVPHVHNVFVIVIRVKCMVLEMPHRILKVKGDVLLCAHPRERERERYYAVHRYLVVCVEVGVKGHQSHPPQNQGKYPH